jgi:hypothetical protein
MRPTELLIVKTGMMLDTEHVHDNDDDMFEDEIFKLPRVSETGISGAAGFYLLFEYDNLEQAVTEAPLDVKAAEAVILKYEARNVNWLAHPVIDGGSKCCGEYGANRDEKDDLNWSMDDQQYFCAGCDNLVDI